MESKTILLSAVSDSDPIKQGFDGPMMHICRQYRPDKVYLYLSGRMVEQSRLDDRFEACLRLLGETIGKEFEIIPKNREDLENAHMFDAFFDEFEEILQEIYDDNPGSRILVNITSGTPAMQQALCTICALSKFPAEAVQVSSPMTRTVSPSEKEDWKKLFEENKDNDITARNRCESIPNANFLIRMQAKSIERLIKEYNYSAALLLAQEIEASLPEKTIALVKAANCRMDLNSKRYLKNIPEDLKDDRLRFTAKKDREIKIVEYFMNLDIKRRQEHYADFVRGLTPLIFELGDKCITGLLCVSIRDKYCDVRSKKLLRKLLEKDSKGKRILSALEKHENGFSEMVYTSSYQLLILKDAADQETADLFQKLRKIEKDIRNIAAHEITSITEEKITEWVGYSPKDIMKLLIDMMGKARIPNWKTYWDEASGNTVNAYDAMNKVIIESLRIVHPTEKES